MQLEELQGSMEVRVRQLANLSEVAEDIKFDLNRHNSQFSPADRISEQPAAAIGGRLGCRWRAAACTCACCRGGAVELLRARPLPANGMRAAV